MSNCSGNNPYGGNNPNKRKGYYYRREIQPYESDYTGNFWDISGTSIFNTNGCGDGFVGIGNNNPQYNLDVSGILNVSNRIITYGISAELADINTADINYIIDVTGSRGFPSANTKVLGSTAAGLRWIDVSGSGGGGSLPSATEWSEYLYYDTTLGAYVSGGGNTADSSRLHLVSGAGQGNQGTGAIALGYQAGQSQQGARSIAIGVQSGQSQQGINSIAIGYQAGISGEKSGAISMGFQAGAYNQGTNSIAIGNFAGRTNQMINSIIINATGTDLSSIDMSGLYIAPIRQGRENFLLTYNTNNKEIRYTADLSLNSLDVSQANIRDLSATKIWTRDLSSVNLQISGTGIINDLSATKIWTRDLSAVNLQISGTGIINDLSATKIWTRDLSASNIAVSNLIGNFIDGSFNIINTNDNNTYYPLFTNGSGYQKLRIDTNKLIYNPGLDRLGINIDPSYNLDVSGSLRTRYVIDISNSDGIDISFSNVLISTSNGIKWSTDLSLNNVNVKRLVGNSINITKLDASINIIDDNTDKVSYLVFVDNSGYQSLQVDTNLLSYNPGLNRLGVGLVDPSYNIDVLGSIRALDAMYIGRDNSNGILYFGSGSSGDANIFSGYYTSVIETWQYGLNEKSEMLLFKGNDSGTGLPNDGPDRIRIRAGAIAFDTYDDRRPSSLANVISDRRAENIRMYIEPSGNVGIGTITPSYMLDVSGSFRSKTIIDISGLSGNNNQVLTSTVNGYIWKDISSSGGSGGTNYWTLTSGGSDIFNNTASNNGNVGIGVGSVTSIPYKLDVSGSARMRYIIDINSSDGSNNSILIGTTNGIRWSKDISLNNIDISNKAIINDLSATKIWTRDISAVNGTIINLDVSSAIIKNLNVGNIDGSLNILDTNDNNIYYPIFASGSGYQKLRIDSNKLIYNPGLDRLGINRDPSYNLDVSGSLRTTTIIDRLSVTGNNGQVLTSTITGIEWKDISSSSGLPTANVWSEYLYYDGTAFKVGGGSTNSDLNRLHLASGAGQGNQGANAVALGYQAGQTQQGTNSIAVGIQAGNLNQSGNSISIGNSAGKNTQGSAAIAIGYVAGEFSQGSSAVAIGNSAGMDTQGTNAIAIGVSAGHTIQGQAGISIGVQAGGYYQSSGGIAIGFTAGKNTQGIDAIAIGNFAGQNSQGYTSIAIGYTSAATGQGDFSVAIGNGAGYVNQGSASIAIGNSAGTTRQGNSSIAIGNFAGYTDQSNNSIAIGTNAGYNNQNKDTISIGTSAGYTRQSVGAIAIGYEAGLSNEATFSLAIGYQAGRYNQSSFAIGIGYQAGDTGQGKNAIAIGFQSGDVRQESASIAIGYQAGFLDQSSNSIAIGDNAGALNQDYFSIAIGASSGYTNQNRFAVAIGTESGYQRQGSSTIAIGYVAGKFDQSRNAIAIGDNAGVYTQGGYAIAIGTYAGSINQGQRSIAIGNFAGISNEAIDAIAIGSSAGRFSQGTNSIAIGNNAGYSSQHQNTIIINATGNILNSTTASATYINPIRSRTTINSQLLYHDLITKEVFVAGSASAGKVNVYSLYDTNTDISMSTATKFYPIVVDGSGDVIAYIDNRDFVFDISRNRLGIGISDPSYNLDISGSARITNQLLVGNVTTSSLVFDVVGDTRIQSDNIRFGTNSGNTSQNSYAIAIGYNAGAFTQLSGALSIGYSSGQTAQGANAVAIGTGAGQATQGGSSVAIGYLAGQTLQGAHAVAIGREAGAFQQGTYSIAIGYYAGRTGQPQNSIVLNATNSDLTGSSANGLFISPIRSTTPTMAISKALYYDTTTNEVLYGDISGGGGGGTNYWTLSGSNLYNNTGTNIGINTSTPSFNLDISGNTRITNDLKIGNSTTITKVINNTDGSMNIVNTCANPSVTDVYFTFKPDSSNIQIDISFANWGTNNVLSILDIKSAGRSTSQPRGCAILSGQIYADNSGSNQFDNFINVGLTRKDCILTTTSPGPYTLRLSIDPTYQMDVYSGSINIINATSASDITAISLRKV